MSDSYEGPRHGKGDEDFVSIDRCGGVVVGASRFPEYPLPTPYSRAVRRRIAGKKYEAPKRSLVQLLGWAA